ncbi:MAG TPA: hypothetical protein V6D08_16525 [Candidatus Obscuribacterales bacterium]
MRAPNRGAFLPGAPRLFPGSASVAGSPTGNIKRSACLKLSLNPACYNRLLPRSDQVPARILFDAGYASGQGSLPEAGIAWNGPLSGNEVVDNGGGTRPISEEQEQQ